MMIETERLILRPFKQSDLEAYAAMNADPEVMRFYQYPSGVPISRSVASR